MTPDAGPTRARSPTALRWPAALGLALGAVVVVGVGVRAPLPAAALAVVGAIAAAVAIRHPVVRRGSLLLAAVLIGLLATEGLLRALEAGRPPERFEGDYTTSAYWNRRHPDLGYAPVPGASVRAAKYTGDALVYDVRYTIDANGLRRSMPADAPEVASAETVCVLFFGGSITFGEGVEDAASMPYRVAVRAGARYRVYNFGFHGYGPHHMLAALERGVVTRSVDCPGRVVAVLQYDVGHVERMRGSPWDSRGPRYVLGPDGRLQAAGRFDEPAPPDAPRRERRPWQALRLVQRIQSALNLPYYDAEDVALFDAAILTAKSRLEERFPDVEVHLILRDPWRDEAVVGVLAARGVAVHPIHEVVPGFSLSDPRFRLDGDPHPNAMQHDAIARYVAERILEVPQSSSP